MNTHMQVSAYRADTMRPNEEYMDKLNKHIQKVTLAAVMNNTKWREVFLCLSKFDISITICSIYGFLSPYQTSTQVIADYLYVNGIGDCISGGPILFQEIAYIVIPFKQSKTSEIDISMLGKIIERLNQLGQLEIVKDDQCLSVYGYLMNPSFDKQLVSTL